MKTIVPDQTPAESTLTHVECRLAHAQELLLCATAAAYETADGLQGPQQHLAMASMHLMNQVHLTLDQVLSQWPAMCREIGKPQELPV